jgi:Membrane protein involved in the export of O-antigen and teichoic acid
LNQYKRLLSNTALFALSTFSSKVLVFLLMPLYTRVLTAEDYGTVDLIVQSANLLIPIVSLGIMNSVIRFGLDKGYSKKGVFTTGLVCIGGGFAVFLALFPFVGKLPFLKEYMWLLYGYVLCACLRSLFSQFVRAKQYIRLYAFDGLFSTACTVGFNILFLVVLKKGITGYILAIICADLASCLFLLLIADLHRYINFSALKKPLVSAMLLYAIPMIPSTLFWWITNVSDRYMVTYMVSEAANGLYAVAYKIPTLVTLFSTIFTEAWQLSAVEAQNSKGRNKFFSTIFSSLQGIVFVAGSGLILTCNLIMKYWVAEDYFLAWRYIPILILATVFSCFANFLSSVYMVEKKSGLSLATTFVGAAISVGLNLYLIPKYGVNGAAISTFVSYFIVFIIRAINTRKFVKINIGALQMLLTTLLLIGQTVLMLSEIKYRVLFAGGVFLLVGLINAPAILQGIRRMLYERAT